MGVAITLYYNVSVTCFMWPEAKDERHSGRSEGEGARRQKTGVRSQESGVTEWDQETLGCSQRGHFFRLGSMRATASRRGLRSPCSHPQTHFSPATPELDNENDDEHENEHESEGRHKKGSAPKKGVSQQFLTAGLTLKGHRYAFRPTKG
jgi:hypothetical protein